MEAVRSAMSMVGAAEGYRPTLDIDHAERRRNALQMCAVTPTLIMAIHRLQAGLEPIDPRDDLGYGAKSEEHTSELQSLMRSSYAVFCLKKKKKQKKHIMK